jgi:hypothetical protein
LTTVAAVHAREIEEELGPKARYAGAGVFPSLGGYGNALATYSQKKRNRLGLGPYVRPYLSVATSRI